MTIERIYRFTVPLEALEGASTQPPLEPARRVLAYEWRLDEPDFDRIPELRRWLDSEGLLPEEEGLVRQTPTPGSLSLLTGGTSVTADLSSDPRTREVCPGCGRITVELRENGSPDLGGHLGGSGFVYLSGLDAFAAPTDVVERLFEAGLSEGLETRSLVRGRYRLLAASTSVGEPVAPFGSTGVPCAACGRHGVRVGDRTYPGLPRYSFYYLYARPRAAAQWLWSTIDGQTRPMVTSDVAEWLTAHDPTIRLQRRGWYPDELDDAFLDERLR